MVTELLLEVEDLCAHYGEGQVLNGVNLHVAEGHIHSLLGRNGAGKSTTIKSIMGMIPITGGRIRVRGKKVKGFSPHDMAKLGLGYVPEERRIFGSLSVSENLEIARGKGGSEPWALDRVFQLFPALAQRHAVLGRHLSGGEQQMLAIARILRQGASLLLLDEPTEGLAPLVIKGINAAIRELKSAGMTVLIVEQNLAFTMELADLHYIISKGRIVYEGNSQELRSNLEMQKRYLAV